MDIPDSAMNAKRTKYPSICFIGLRCYELLSSVSAPRFIGGIEQQLFHLSRSMLARGFPVSFITLDHGQRDGQSHGGIRSYKAYVRTDGLPVLRFVHPRWTGLCSAMSRADADVYYQMGAGCETGQAALWCRRHGRRLIFSPASDLDCNPRLPAMGTVRERVLYRYGLGHASRVIVQTTTQREMLRTGFGVDSEMIPMLCPPPENFDLKVRQRMDAERHRVLWIGRVCKPKRPDRLLEVAEACSDLMFDLVGPIYDDEYGRDVQRRAECIPNVRVHGAVSRDRVPKF